MRVDKNKTYNTYDLVDVKENQQVDVKIYAKVKGIDKPIFKVAGDIGKGKTPGSEKIIVWNYLLTYNIFSAFFFYSGISKYGICLKEKCILYFVPFLCQNFIFHIFKISF